MLHDLIRAARSFRRFKQSPSVHLETLEELVDLARLSASAANLQPLRYILTHDAETCAQVFPTLAWAGYLEDWDGPAEGERPAAYITILHDTAVAPKIGCDHGIAAQSIVLGATECGLGACMIGSIDRPRLGEALGVRDGLEILLVIALGVPAETVVLEECGEDGSIRYYRDEHGIHHVPKRPLADVILRRH